jgi:hypothetical protein
LYIHFLLPPYNFILIERLFCHSTLLVYGGKIRKQREKPRIVIKQVCPAGQTEKVKIGMLEKEGH